MDIIVISDIFLNNVDFVSLKEFILLNNESKYVYLVANSSEVFIKLQKLT